MNEKTPEARLSYEIVSVKRAETPAGAEGSSWYRYVISYEGNDNITGCRQGSLGAVTEAVEEIVTQLNGRHKGKHGRVHLVPAPKKAPASNDTVAKS